MVNGHEDLFDDSLLELKERPTIEYAQSLLEIQYADTKSLLELCTFFSIGLIMCDNFTITNGQIHISGSQVNDLEPEIESLKEILNSVYNNS